MAGAVARRSWRTGWRTSILAVERDQFASTGHFPQDDGELRWLPAHRHLGQDLALGIGELHADSAGKAEQGWSSAMATGREAATRTPSAAGSRP